MLRRRLLPRALAALSLVAGVLVALAPPAQALTAFVADGNARFDVLSPTLIRLE